MAEIKSIGLIICILMVLMAYLKQAIPRGKTTYLMKAIISIFILLSIFEGIRNFNFNSLRDLLDSSYAQNDEVWAKSARLIEDGLKKEFTHFLIDEGVMATVESITVEGNQDAFEIRKVIVSGQDAQTAKNLLAGRYQIGIAYIEVKNE